MGVFGLTRFLNENFTRWKPLANLKDRDRVVIDGNSICYTLYTKYHTWCLGGEYKTFAATVEQFFKEAPFNHPLVVFDDSSYDKQKIDTQKQRRVEAMREMQDLQKGGDWDPVVPYAFIGGSEKDARVLMKRQRRADLTPRTLEELDSKRQCRIDTMQGQAPIFGCTLKPRDIVSDPESEVDQYLEFDKPLPLLLLYTFMNVLRRKEIDFIVACGEADQEIAVLANQHGCPVMSSDSDFFIFELKHGFIHFDRYLEGEMPLYHIKDFRKQFSLQDYKLCLIIPAVFGNDLVEYDPERQQNHEVLLKKLAKYCTCEEYLSSRDNAARPQHFKIVKHQYCNLEMLDPTTRYHVPSRPHQQLLPEWVQKGFRVGMFSTPLLGTYRSQIVLLPRVVEAIEKESAWLISRYIRQFLYGFLGLPKVQEIIRISHSTKLREESVISKNFKSNPTTIFDDVFIERNCKILSDLVLAVLKCHKIPESDIADHFNSLGNWKLPIAATFYWYQMLEVPPPLKTHLVKSLLLCFLTCSRHISPMISSPEVVKEHTKSDHLAALHAFAQWQCVYYDAMALNYLAREPFDTLSPSSLYSGVVAMHYANLPTGILDAFISKKSKERSLYNNFLYLITGRDEEGRVAEHAK